MSSKAEQLQLAKELRSEFQRKGTFHRNQGSRHPTSRLHTSRTQGSGPQPPRPKATCPSPTLRPSNPLGPSSQNPGRLHSHSSRQARQEARQGSVVEPRSQNSAPSRGKHVTSSNNLKRKMDAQAKDFFADRADDAPARGPVHYYQGQDYSATTTIPAPHPAPIMDTDTAQSKPVDGPAEVDLLDLTAPELQPMPPSQLLQSTMTWMAPGGNGIPLINNGAGATNTSPAPVNTGIASVDNGMAPPATLSIHGQMPQVPVVWHYQDNNDVPVPLTTQESMMDMDMPDIPMSGGLADRSGNQPNHCTCTSSSKNTKGLGASRWAKKERILDVNCPRHGGTPLQNDNGSGADQGGAENAPKPRIWYYQSE